MLKFKPGVSLKGLTPQMVLALEVVQEAFKSYGLDTVVTSANDGTHKTNSFHYQGRAFDFRTKHSGNLGKGIAGAIRERLGPIGFDVVYEDPGGENEHIHVEYDPKEVGRNEGV